MAGERRLHILRLLGGLGEQVLDARRLCEVCAEATGVTGAGIMLMPGDTPHGSLCTTDAVSDTIEQLQYGLGEGPCVDPHEQGVPVLEPDLANPRTPRWFAFSGPAIEAGARAVFGFPLQVGAIKLGALHLHRDHPGTLSDDQHADALVMAAIAAATVLMLQANAPPGKLAAELEAGTDFHYVVHQATGMVAAQLAISVAEALIRLQEYSFANDRSLADVARDVVVRSLRFTTRGERRP